MKNRVVTIAQKEFLHIIHDPRTLLIIIIMPIMQLILFGYALRMELQELRLGVVDLDRTIESEQMFGSLESNGFIKPYFTDIDKIDEQFIEQKADAVLVIPKGFFKDLLRKDAVELQHIIDASDPNKANYAKSYLQTAINKFFAKKFGKNTTPYRLTIRNWYNPQGKSTYFIVPGILAIILVMICALLTSIAIAREKETGTLEQLLMSSIQSREIIIGKVIPYIVLGFLDAALVAVLSVILFQVPLLGNIFLLVVLTLLYISTALSLGILISTIADSQQNAMMMALASTLLPSMFLSGFIYPINCMPKFLQIISYIIPAKYYLQIVRGIMLKGNGLQELLMPSLSLLIMSVILLAVASANFNKRLKK